jgi:ubiquinone/menaquinone biosynthesis C-methylase UbiE
MERWYPDELAMAGSEHLNAEFVAGYDRKQQFDPSPDVALLEELGIGSDAMIVDLGAGTGTFAVAAAASVGTVVAVDISPVMVEVLRRRAQESAVENIVIAEAGLLSYSHTGPAPAAVYCRNVLHHLPDFWKGVALQRIAGLLAPNGVLLVRDIVYDFEPASAPARIGEWLAGASDDPTVGYTAEDLVEHLQSEHSTYRTVLDSLIESAGFRIVDVEFRRSVYASYTCVVGG